MHGPQQDDESLLRLAVLIMIIYYVIHTSAMTIGEAVFL